jgi:beta-carotene ketolase (CrtO type)
MAATDVVVIGAGHNGLVCASYLARAGLQVTILESAPHPGGCIFTDELPDGQGRLERGAYEHGGIVGTGVAADLQLAENYGLEWIERDELVLSPCDDGSALAFHRSLDRTVELLGEVVGSDEAERYRRFVDWAAAASNILHQADGGPPPTLRELSALAEVSLGSEGRRFMQALLSSATDFTNARFTDDRLRGTLCHWASHSQQPSTEPGTAAGAILFGSFHGHPSVRPKGGSRGTIDALVRCFEAAGGTVRCSAAVERVELTSDGSRALAVHAAGERFEARRAIVSAIDAKRLFQRLIGPDGTPDEIAGEVARMHTGGRNVGEIKVDAVIDALPKIPGPEGFERSLLLSPNTGTDIRDSFASVMLGSYAKRPPLMIAFPSALEPGWAPDGRHVVWISTWIPFEPSEGSWTDASLDTAADQTWEVAEQAIGSSMKMVERRVTGPEDWVAHNGNPMSNPNHISMSLDQLLSNRPSPSLSRYSTPVGGLFLTGAGTHPGGGITGAPGRNAAAVVLDSLGIRRRSTVEAMKARAALFSDALKAARSLGGSA